MEKAKYQAYIIYINNVDTVPVLTFILIFMRYSLGVVIDFSNERNI